MYIELILKSTLLIPADSKKSQIPLYFFFKYPLETGHQDFAGWSLKDITEGLKIGGISTMYYTIRWLYKIM